MAKRIIILLAEGDHDAAFLYRILRANNFVAYSKSIKEFPAPLDHLLASDILNISIPDSSIQSAKIRFLPNNVVEMDGNLILIYALHGESRQDRRLKIIDAFDTLNTSNQNEIQVMKDTSLAILYFIDGDDKGVKNRLIEINEELNLAFDGADIPLFTENESIIKIDDILFGVWIFVESGKDVGKLEDVLMPMMEDGNEDIFKEARNFLSIHERTVLYKGKLEYNEDGSVRKVYKDKFDIKKSIIGTVGQLHKSGKSNTVCISDSHYLSGDKIRLDAVCQRIFKFVKMTMI